MFLVVYRIDTEKAGLILPDDRIEIYTIYIIEINTDGYRNFL